MHGWLSIGHGFPIYIDVFSRIVSKFTYTINGSFTFFPDDILIYGYIHLQATQFDNIYNFANVFIGITHFFNLEGIMQIVQTIKS